MRLIASPLHGVSLVESTAHVDARGSFYRGYCEKQFAELGLPIAFPQHNFSVNLRAHTLRGLHYQPEAAGEYKLVRCVNGRIWDVVADLRPESPSFRQWWGVELSADTPRALFIPAGCAHGFLTLEAGSSLYYLMGCEYREANRRGLRWDDPTLAVAWPHAPQIISPEDAALPFLEPAHA